jgi:putative transposase
MEAEKAGHDVRLMCAVLGVSPSGFYAWRGRPTCRREIEDDRLRALISAIHAASRGTYGVPRVWAALRKEHGARCSRKRVARLMRQAGMVGAHRRRKRGTTRRDPQARPPADLVNRDFRASRPDQTWVADIKEVLTGEGKLYVAGLTDIFTRGVVGLAMRERMETEVVTAALEMAVALRRPGPGTVHHSDQGSQYTSIEYGRRLQASGLVASMGSRGDCFDNALAEAFWATLDRELLSREVFPDRQTARRAIFEYVMGWYNRRRLHSALGMLSPAEFEERWRAGQLGELAA